MPKLSRMKVINRVSIQGKASKREDGVMHLDKHITPFDPDCFLPHKIVIEGTPLFGGLGMSLDARDIYTS